MMVHMLQKGNFFQLFMLIKFQVEEWDCYFVEQDRIAVNDLQRN